MLVLSVFVFIFGTIIGSFLNVVIARYDTGLTLGGRSRCFSCNRTLRWFELIPVLSFFSQKGKCRRCGSRISWQYPLVELGVGVLFALIFWFFPPLSLAASFDTIFYLLISSILVVIAVYDAKHKIIPNPFVYTFALLSLVKLFVSPEVGLVIPSLGDILAGPLLALPFFLFWFCSKGKWMGLADSKLTLGIGWVLGLSAGISALVLSIWIGAIISVLWMFVVHKKFKVRYEIPFGPYLILGMYLVLFWHIQVIDTDVFFDLFAI